MSFFTKLGNVKFLGDWKIGNKEYSLEEKVQPILDAGVFSIQTTQTGTSISGGVKLLAGTGCSFVQDDENKTITLNATGIEVTLPEYALSANGKKINLTKDGSISSTITLADDLYEATGAVAAHNISTDCHSDIRLAISEVRSIAEGRSSAKVFDTAEELDSWLQDTSNTETLKVGDHLLIKATESPDYWWDGSDKQVLETAKVDLTDYLTSEAAGQTYLTKNAYETEKKDFLKTISVTGNVLSGNGTSANPITINVATTISSAEAASNNKVATEKAVADALKGKMDKVELAAIALTGSYNDLKDIPEVPDAVTHIQMVRPVSDAGLYPVVEISDTADFANFEQISGNGENSDLFKVFDGTIWNNLPNDHLLGTPYDGMPVTVNIGDFCKEKFPNANPPYYVRYYWVNADDGSSSNKQATMFPSVAMPEPMEDVLTSIEVSDGITTVQATSILLGDGLEAVSNADGQVTIQKKRRTAITFNSGNIVGNKFTVENAMVCDFAIIDGDGVMVLPVIQQSGDNVVIDFEDWEITGTWKIIFR